MTAAFKRTRFHLNVPGPDGGWYPFRVVERRARALTDAGELRPALQAYESNTDWAGRAGDADTAAGAHLALSIHLMMMGQHDQAEQHLERAAELYGTLGNEAQLRAVLLWRSKVCSSKGQFDQALELLDQLDRSLPADDTAMAVSLSVFRGNVHFWKGEFDRALVSFQRQLDDARARGKKETELNALINIGLVRRERGELNDAAGCFEQVMALARPLGLAAYYAMALGSLGGVHCYRGKLRLAQRCFQEQLRLTERMGDAYSTSCAVGDLASVHIELGELDEARRCVERELAMCRMMKDELGISFATYKQGMIETEAGRLDQALPLLQWCVAEARRLGSERFLDLYLVQLAEIHYRTGDFSAAARANDEALPLQPDNPQTVLAKTMMQARLLAARDPSGAESILLPLLETCPAEREKIYVALCDTTGKREYRDLVLALLTAQYREQPSPRLEKQIASLRLRGTD